MKRNMKRMLGTVVGSALALLFAGQVQAAGTTADTTISNTASVTFTIGGGTPPPVSSNTVDFKVDRMVRVVVTNTNSGNVGVIPASTNNVLSFTVKNESNTNAVDTDFFYLEASNGGGTFNMTTPFKIYLDADQDGILDPADTELTGDALSVAIAVDTTEYFLVVADAPDNTTITATGMTSEVHLKATAWSNGTAAGPALPQDPDNTNDPTVSEVYWADDAGSLGLGVDDARDGFHSAMGTFESNWTNLGVTKTESSATGYHIPGDIVTYTITVKNSDTASDATGVLISDQIPVNTTFESGTLDCSSLTGSSEQYSDSIKGTALASITWSNSETSPVNFVGCSGGTIVKNNGTVDGEGSMSFQVAID